MTIEPDKFRMQGLNDGGGYVNWNNVTYTAIVKNANDNSDYITGYSISGGEGSVQNLVGFPHPYSVYIHKNGQSLSAYGLAGSWTKAPEQPPTITTTSLPSGTVGTAYSQTLTATGDTPITWSIDAGRLPTGLMLSNGTISGTPTTAGTFNFTVKATNATGSDTKMLSIVIASGGSSLPDLPGDITITPSVGTIIGMELTAYYSGDETVSYQWNRNETAIANATQYKFTPSQTGNHTVTVSATGYNPKTSAVVTVSLQPLSIGDTGPGGGKIFYYSEAGFTMTDNNQVCHYLEAAPANMPATLAWASSGYTYTTISGTSESIGTGRKNTALILATDANAPTAKACKDYSNNGMTDWFLPSKDELRELYRNRALIGMGNSGVFWSSTHYDNNYTTVWVLSFSLGALGGGTKSDNHDVRAIRAF
jgi:hypothetical protein